MSLFWCAFCLGLRQGLRRLWLVWAVLLGCLLAFGPLSEALRQGQAYEPLLVVDNRDDHPLTWAALDWLQQSGREQSPMELLVLQPGQQPPETYAACILIPSGFCEGVLRGENPAPVVQLQLTSPAEQLAVRQLAAAVAKYLSGAQAGIYAVLYQVDYGSGMDPAAYNQLVAQVNLAFLRAFLDREALLRPQALSAWGSLGLEGYMLSAVLALLVQFYVAFATLPALLAFARQALQLPLSSRGRCGRALFWGGGAGCLGCGVLLLLPLGWEAWCRGGWQGVGALGLAACLAGSGALLLAQLSHREVGALSLALLWLLAAGLLAGCLLPAEWLPPAAARLAPWLPPYRLRQLMGAALGEVAPPGAWLWSAALAGAQMAAARLFWQLRLGKEAG